MLQKPATSSVLCQLHVEVHTALAANVTALLVKRLLLLQGTAIKLFRFNDEGGAGAWELHAPAVTPHFFDANEDAASAQPKWHLEADEAEAEVTDQFSLELGGRRVIFRGSGAIWALLFPSDAAFRAFTDQYNDRLFANTYGVDNDEDNRAKARPQLQGFASKLSFSKCMLRLYF